MISELTSQSLAFIARGKSELQRAERWLTARCREATDSATENRPPMGSDSSGKGEMVV